MRWTPLLPLLLGLLLCLPACSGTREPEGDPAGEASGPCEPVDPCTGTNCGVLPTGCPGGTISCACDPDLRCEKGICEPGLLVEDEPPEALLGCDPVNPCDGTVCGEVSAGCPGATAHCACAPGRRCQAGECVRPRPRPRPRPDPEPRPKPKPTGNRRGCKADAQHCCLADDTIVKPGGCSSIYPRGVRPSTVRGADGSCEQIPCRLRCLPAAARIQAIGGEVRIDALVVGDRVWTLDERGERVLVPVLRVEAKTITGEHTLLEVSLADGRRVRASPGHPTATGLLLSDLVPGDPLDGSTVSAVRERPYDGAATWDLLPAGPTGTYWSDGVLLGSTLAPSP